ncbi:hypothetical protein D0862_09458 [Hortaea werneckii]|uniref:Uncharacterized protein n=1 Tax=Hortaea werneckii TaxID=91943 RepID=A0A3M7FUM8_HORWE|nr:hypothetical protein D0862_09458 [Hortaea werneckii]
MHPVSALTFGIFLAGYITARWDLVTRLYELAIFAWDHGVITRAAKGFTILSIFFVLLLIPIERIAAREAAFVSTNTSKEYSIESDDSQNPQPLEGGISAREQLRRRGDAPKDGISGILVGWRNNDLDVLVVSVLQGVEARNVDHALRVQTLFRSSPHPIDHILDRCGKHPLQVLGTLNAPSTTLHFEPKFLSLRYERKDAAPRIDCPHDTGFTVQVVVFDRPDPKRMQYLSMTPISLALADNGAAYGSVPPFNTFITDEDADKKRRRKLVEKLKQHTVVRHPRTPKELALPTVINQVNCSAELNDLMQSNIGLVGVRTRRSLSVSERLAESAAHLRNSVVQSTKSAYQKNIWPILSEVFIFILMVQRILAEATLQLLDWAPFPNAAALKDISATAQQVDIRLQQFCYWPAQYMMLQKRRSDWESISYSHSEYIRFYNSLWLVANDVIIGIAIGSYILENSAHVAAFIDDLVDDYSIAGLQRMITWLENNPAGFKLNNELANFLGDLFLWVIDYWDNSVVQLRPLLPYIVRAIGWSAFAGASLPISLVSDWVSVLTVHIYSFYIASARIYNWQLTIITSLFHLFRGKKRNPLRNRVDSCDYDLDQLLLGTILFTLLFFLLPTVAVFYATFAGARMGIMALKAALDIWLACLNHFPLFAIMLRLKDARRLPGGIRFELLLGRKDTLSANGVLGASGWQVAPTSYVKLKGVPLPLSQTFSQYFELGRRLRKHYLSPSVFVCLLSGQFVPPIHRKNLYSLQYSMLPVRRVSIGELWQLLKGERPVDSLGATNGHATGPAHSEKKGKHGKGKGYWWSR